MIIELQKHLWGKDVLPYRKESQTGHLFFKAPPVLRGKTVTFQSVNMEFIIFLDCFHTGPVL